MTPDEIPDELIVALDDARNAGLLRWRAGRVQAHHDLDPALRCWIDEHHDLVRRLLRPLKPATPGSASALEAEEHHALAALIELMDGLGASFVMKPPDEVGVVGAELPAWCDAVVRRWCELIVDAYAGVASGHHLYACSACCFPMLLLSARAGRRCPVCNAKGAMTYRLPVRFVDPPLRRKPAPKRSRDEDPPALDEPAPPQPAAWPACSHSLISRVSRDPDVYRCSYCLREVPAP